MAPCLGLSLPRDRTDNDRRGGAVSRQQEGQGRRTAWSPWYVLFILQLFAVLWVPYFNRVEPTWLGIPFFYWYQLLWVVISAILTVVIYFRVPE
jgi:hypothetical protein